MIHLGDITKINGATIPVVDVVTGGSPCQDLSVAGKRAGLSGERSGLFMEQIRIIKEMREHDRSNGRTDEFVRPRFMVWENVPGALSSNDGEDFRIVLEETARIADPNAVIPRFEGGAWKTSGCIMADGWSIAWRVHDAQFWGSCQRRVRVSLVADFNGQSAPEILFERKGMHGNSSEISEEICIPGYTERDTGDSGGRDINSWYVFDSRGLGNGRIVPTLAGDHSNRVTNTTAICFKPGEDAKVRRLTPTECERLQGFPDGWTDIGEWTDSKGKLHKESSDTARYKALGNSIAVPYWKVLARKIAAQYDRDITMGSLFDGIGGFPLAFEHCGAKAVWASEIEEFPIAVTKRHFPEESEVVTVDTKAETAT